MVTYLCETGKIETTVTRAKEVRAMAEKMITLGKREDLHAKRQVFSFIKMCIRDRSRLCHSGSVHPA